MGLPSRFLVSSICALALVGSCGLAGATSSKASAARISAHLTKTSFKSSQAGSIKLIYKFSAKSKRFSYLLSFKKGSKWQTVKSVKQTGTFKGSKSMTVKKVFAGRSVKVGSYRLKLSADGGSKLLRFKVVKAKSGGPLPTGNPPTNTSVPTISGTTTQGQTLSASHGSWDNSPTSYAYQWQRCDEYGASCSDISGATSSSYTLVLADANSTICVVVTASNSGGSASETSSETAVVVGISPAHVVANQSGFTSVADIYATAGTDVSWGAVLENTSPDAAAIDSTVTVNMLDASNLILRTDTEYIHVINPSSHFYLGGFAEPSRPGTVTALQLIVQTGGSSYQTVALPSITNVALQDDEWDGLHVVGELSNTTGAPVSQMTEISAVVFNASGNIVGGGSDSLAADVPAGTSIGFDLSPLGISTIPVSSAASVKVSVDPWTP